MGSSLVSSERFTPVTGIFWIEGDVNAGWMSSKWPLAWINKKSPGSLPEPRTHAWFRTPPK